LSSQDSHVEELAKVVKQVAEADGTAKFNVPSTTTNEKGEVVFMDDNKAAWDSQEGGNMRAGNINMKSIQSLDSQSPELGMGLVGHFLLEGLAMRTGKNYTDDGGPGAHSVTKRGGQGRRPSFLRLHDCSIAMQKLMTEFILFIWGSNETLPTIDRSIT